MVIKSLASILVGCAITSMAVANSLPYDYLVVTVVNNHQDRSQTLQISTASAESQLPIKSIQDSLKPSQKIHYGAGGSLKYEIGQSDHLLPSDDRLIVSFSVLDAKNVFLGSCEIHVPVNVRDGKPWANVIKYTACKNMTFSDQVTGNTRTVTANYN